MKKLLVTTFATALLTGCGAQPTQESASKTPVKPREPVTLAPAQPVPEATPAKPTAPAPAVPEVKPVEPVAKKKQASRMESGNRRKLGCGNAR